MAKLEKAALFFMGLGILSAMFITPLKLSLIVSLVCITLGWLCVAISNLKR